MIIQKSVLLLTGVISLLCCSPAKAGDATKGKELYATCQTCHGENAEGNQATGSPRLVGLQEWYLTRQIESFRTGLRGADPNDVYGQQMAAMAKVLPDKTAIEDVVAYIVKLESPPSPRTETSGDPQKGETTFSDCMQCHGSQGQGLDTGDVTHPPSPRLSGQDDWYLIKQLHNFASGVRGSNSEDKSGTTMRMVAKTRRWSDQEIKNVVAYIKTLK